MVCACSVVHSVVFGNIKHVAFLRTTSKWTTLFQVHNVRLRLKCDGTRAETRFRLTAQRASPFKSAGASFQSTIGSRGVRISGSNAGYTMLRGSVKSTGYTLHSRVSPFTYPPVRHRVPSRFNWSLLQLRAKKHVCPSCSRRLCW
jgi:hypothetical protein